MTYLNQQIALLEKSLDAESDDREVLAVLAQMEELVKENEVRKEAAQARFEACSEAARDSAKVNAGDTIAEGKLPNMDLYDCELWEFMASDAELYDDFNLSGCKC